MTGTNGSNAFDNANARVELLRAVGLCHPGWSRLRGLTFSPDSSSCPAWLPWKERIFATILWPRIAEARSACAAGDLRALADCDQAIDSALPASFRAASSRAGRFLLAHYSAPKSRETLAALPRADRFRRCTWAPGYPLCVARSDLPSLIRRDFWCLYFSGGQSGPSSKRSGPLGEHGCRLPDRTSAARKSRVCERRNDGKSEGSSSKRDAQRVPLSKPLGMLSSITIQ